MRSGIVVTKVKTCVLRRLQVPCLHTDTLALLAPDRSTKPCLKSEDRFCF